MTPEAQRIAIAEACGWRDVPGTYRTAFYPPNLHPLHNIYGHKLPDYLKDLNAMAEAEEVLTSDQRASFERHLHKMCYPDYGKTWLSASPLSMFPLIHATATQRAEAFLRTLGKWEETK